MKKYFAIAGILVLAILATVALEKAAPQSSCGKYTNVQNAYCNEKFGFVLFLQDYPQAYNPLVNAGENWIEMDLLPQQPERQLQVYAESGANYCFHDLCERKAIRQETYNGIVWGYLGVDGYCDGDNTGGGCDGTKVYRTRHGERAFYVKATSEVVAQAVMKGFIFSDTAIVETPTIIDRYIDEVGRIATTSSGYTYTSPKYGFRFSYPKGWYLGDNHIANGTLQFTNYDPATAGGKDGFPPGLNKIEAGICNSVAGSTPDTGDYPDMKVVNAPMTIAGEKAMRSDTDLGIGQNMRSYSVQLPQSSKALCITIYGAGSSNFYVLDDLVASLQWTR